MIIDCDDCQVRDLACGDCVVSVLLGAPPARSLPWPATRAGAAQVGTAGCAADGRAAAGAEGLGVVELDDAESRALSVLAGSGLVPPLRLVPRATGAPGGPPPPGEGAADPTGVVAPPGADPAAAGGPGPQERGAPGGSAYHGSHGSGAARAG